MSTKQTRTEFSQVSQIEIQRELRLARRDLETRPGDAAHLTLTQTSCWLVCPRAALTSVRYLRRPVDGRTHAAVKPTRTHTHTHSVEGSHSGSLLRQPAAATRWASVDKCRVRVFKEQLIDHSARISATCRARLPERGFTAGPAALEVH